MDLGRFGYSRDCRFFRDNGTTAKIRWYVAPENAKWFPATHKFSQLAWTTAPWEATGVGEDFDSPIIRNKPITPPSATGQDFFGKLEDFQNGCTFDSSINVERDRWGLANDCIDEEANYLLQEADNFPLILQEDGSGILLEG